MKSRTLLSCVSLLLVALLGLVWFVRRGGEASGPLVRGRALDDLVVAPNAPVFAPDGGVFIELVRDAEGWRVHCAERSFGRADDDIALAAKVAEAKEMMETMGYAPVVLLSAPADMKSGAADEALQSCASEGANVVSFLVAGGDGTMHAVPHHVLRSEGVWPDPGYEPKLLVAREDGSLWRGMGREQIALSSLEGLRHDLGLYAEVCEMVGHRKAVHVFAHEAAPYQSLIHLVTACRETGMDAVEISTGSEEPGMLRDMRTVDMADPVAPLHMIFGIPLRTGPPMPDLLPEGLGNTHVDYDGVTPFDDEPVELDPVRACE